MPPPVTVMAPIRLEVLVFAVIFKTMTPLLDPVAGDTVSHEGALLEAIQEMLEFIDTPIAFEADPGAQLDMPKARVDDIPSCVTVMVLVMPPPVTVMIPIRAFALIFSNASMSNAPSFDPLLGVTISQDEASFITAQETFEVTDTLVMFASYPGDQVEMSRVRLAADAACVTVIVFVMQSPETVIVPARLDVSVFSVTLISKLPLLDPLAGVTVSQEVLLLEAIQLTLEFTDTLVLFAANPGDHVVEPRVMFAFAPDCVMVMVLVTPPPVMVMVPVRLAVPVFAVTLSTRAPLLEPVAGVTVSHERASLEAAQLTFEVTDTLVLFAADPGDQVEDPRVRLAAGMPACVTVSALVMPPLVMVMVPVRLGVLVFVVMLG